MQIHNSLRVLVQTLLYGFNARQQMQKLKLKKEDNTDTKSVINISKLIVLAYKLTLSTPSSYNWLWTCPLFTPGNRSACTWKLYYKGISWPVPVDLLTCVNNFPECWSLHKNWIYLLILCFTTNRKMSYAEIKIQDCYNTCFNGKLHRFIEISFLATTYHALNNKYRGKGCICCAFHDILVRWYKSV